MKSAIKFLKFDLRMIKASSKQYFLIAFIPFNLQGNEKSKEMYFMLPAKVSSMVLGRFIYLICSTLSMFIINGIYIWYLYEAGKIQEVEIIAICLSALISLMVCFVQYPLYYKIGTEKTRIIFILIYIIPGVLVYGLPNIFRENLNLNNENDAILIFISLLIVAVLGGISYLISYKVCKNKQI